MKRVAQIIEFLKKSQEFKDWSDSFVSGPGALASPPIYTFIYDGIKMEACAMNGEIFIYTKKPADHKDRPD